MPLLWQTFAIQFSGRWMSLPFILACKMLIKLSEQVLTKQTSRSNDPSLQIHASDRIQTNELIKDYITTYNYIFIALTYSHTHTVPWGADDTMNFFNQGFLAFPPFHLGECTQRLLSNRKLIAAWQEAESTLKKKLWCRQTVLHITKEICEIYYAWQENVPYLHNGGP